MADAGIDWGLVKAPLSNQAPPSALGAFMGGVNTGNQALSGILSNVQQAPLAMAAPKIVQNQLDSAQLDQAIKTYGMAQQILGPSVMAMQQGDMDGAKSNYERGVQALQGMGIDVKKFGAPEQFDPAFVKSAFTNVSQQMQMAQQMMNMAQAQSMIDYHGSQQLKNQADIAKINYETGGDLPTGGAFKFPGGNQAPSQPQGALGNAGLTPKAAQEVKTEQAKKALEARAKLADQSTAARASLALVNEAESIMNKHPYLNGKTGVVSEYFNSDMERLGKIYAQFTGDKVNTDYAGNGLGALDVVVFNMLKKTVPSISDFEGNQRTGLDNLKVAYKGKILSNTIAEQLNNAGIFDENMRAQIGNQIVAKLGIKEGSEIHMENFNKAPEVVKDVLNQYGIDAKNLNIPESVFSKSSAAQPVNNQASYKAPYTIDQLMATGKFVNKQAAEIAMASLQKQK